MRSWKWIVLFFLAFWLQTTLVKVVSIHNAGPNLVLCLTLFLILTQREHGPILVLAVLTVLLQEICFSDYAGPGAAAILAAGVSASYGFRLFTGDNPAFWAGLTIFETLFYNGLVWTGYALLGSPYKFVYVLGLQPFYLLYNLALMAFFYFRFTKKGERRYRT